MLDDCPKWLMGEGQDRTDSYWFGRLDEWGPEGIA
jgi:hypothetical protein